jgi:hypothetical protein
MDDSNERNPADERRRVLETLERGQISSAEAEDLLAALEGRSTTEERRSPASPRPVAGRPPSIRGLPAGVVSLARALAGTIARLSIILGGVIGTLARLSGRSQAHGKPHDR